MHKGQGRAVRYSPDFAVLKGNKFENKVSADRTRAYFKPICAPAIKVARYVCYL